MRLVRIAVIAGAVALASSVALAQARAGHTGFAPRSGNHSFSGNRLGGSRPIVVPPPVTHTTHVRGAIVPYPVYYGGYYYSGYYYGGDSYADPSAAGTQYAAPAYDAAPGDGTSGQPVVVINQGFRGDQANPLMREYADGQLPEPGPDYHPVSDQATIYLLALTDHTIVPAIAYWVDGDTLNYITDEGSQNRVSLSLVDREFSRQLNDSRHVEFKLPPAK